MVNTVRSRPSHYELLGISPAASSDEIAQAFAKELGMLRPRPFGTLAEVTIAYETLRDPARRGVYDASIGLGAEPHNPSPQVPPEWAPFLLRVSAKPAEEGLAVEPPPPPPVISNFRPSRRIEPRMAPSVSALLREPSPAELLRPKAEEPFHRDEVEESYVPRHDAIPWRLPALGVGALVLAVGVGAWSGWAAGNDNEAGQRLESSVTLKVPSADTAPAAIGEAPVAAQSNAGTEQRTRTEHTLRTLKSVVPKVKQAEAVVSEQTQAEEIATGKVVAEPASVESASSNLPLPNAVVARTIGRIGYSCGEVTSTSAVEGEPGVFKVTCTSGHSYRAAPIHGRYRFRRIGSQ